MPLQSPDGKPGKTDPGDRSSEALRKRSMTVAGHRTSLSLEEAFWRALKVQAAAEGLSLAGLVAKIDRGRQGNLSSAVRVYLLEQAQIAGVAISSPDPQ